MTGRRRSSGRSGPARSNPSRGGQARGARPVVGVPPRGAVGKRAAAKRTRAPAPAGRLTGRATALALVLGALLLAYAYPMRIYLNQQAQIAPSLPGAPANGLSAGIDPSLSMRRIFPCGLPRSWAFGP